MCVCAVYTKVGKRRISLYRVRFDGRGGPADQLCDVIHGPSLFDFAYGEEYCGKERDSIVQGCRPHKKWDNGPHFNVTHVVRRTTSVCYCSRFTVECGWSGEREKKRYA